MLAKQTWKRSVVGVFALWALAGAAKAQVNPETGDVGASGGGQFGGTIEGSGSSSTSSSSAMSTMPSSTVSADSPPSAAPGSPSDVHSMVVGHFGVGFFGVNELPIMACGNGATCMLDAGGTFAAPSVGARYWMSDLLGIEAALGFHFNKTSSSGNADQSGFGLLVHGGVPLALAHTGNFVFEVVPQLNIGFATGSFDPPGPPQSIDLSGFLIEVGAKAGAEIHFGFIDLPQLALQGTLGLMIRHEGRSAETPAGGGGTNKSSGSVTDIATGVDGAPWTIFIGSLSAIYYFGV